MELQTLAWRLCLQNAVQHGGTAQPKGLVGRVMGGHPEFRGDPKAVLAALEAAAKEVNALTPEAQRAALAAEAPELMDAPKKERRTGLKELPDVKGKVVLRFAPNPNGPLSLGHSRGLSILGAYREQYDASLILRFDDTDPQVKPPLWDEKRGWNGYDMIRDDLVWLLGKPADKEVIASDRIEVYYAAARELIKAGGAYVCSCDAEAFRAMKARGEACPHRAEPAKGHSSRFEAMVKGEVDKGGAVLRVKTDIAHRDPALRDWTAFRVVAHDAVHPRAKSGACPDRRCWPLLDFQSAVEDHEQGVTHIIRGKDLMDSTKKQRFLYEHLGWTYPETLYWGRVSVHEFGKFSTSMMRRAIEKGTFTGWDDPRLPTLAALRRRGYSPAAIRRFWVGLGLTEKDIAVSMENIEAEDAKAQDDAAPRYFFVPDPVPMSLSGAEGKVARPMVHPQHAERGRRSLPAEATIHVAAADKAKQLRLKDLGNIVIAGGSAFYTNDEMDRSVPIVQWLPASAAKPFEVLVPGVLGEDATEGEIPLLRTDKGLVEAAAVEEVGKVVQFERYGFVFLESDKQGVWLHA